MSAWEDLYDQIEDSEDKGEIAAFRALAQGNEKEIRELIAAALKLRDLGFGDELILKIVRRSLRTFPKNV
jgi:hypothetical protein